MFFERETQVNKLIENANSQKLIFHFFNVQKMLKNRGLCKFYS